MDEDARYAARTEELKAGIARLAEGSNSAPDSSKAPGHGEPSGGRHAAPLGTAAVDEEVLTAIREAVQRSVSLSVTEAVSTAVRQTLAPTLEDAAALEPRLAALEDALQGVGERLESIARDASALMTATLDGLTQQVALLGPPHSLPSPAVAMEADDPAGANRAGDEPLLALRSDIADALEYVRDELFTRTERGFEALRQALAAGRESSLPAPGGIAADRAELGSAQASLAAAREQLEVGAEAQRADLSALADGVRDDVEAALGQLQKQLGTLSSGVGEVLAEGLTRLEERATSLGERGQADALQPLLSTTRDAVASVLADVRAAAIGQREQVAGLRDDVQLVADRLTGAGRALVEYLAGRDVQLERVRDELAGRFLADVLDGLPAGGREAATRRATGLLQRRREARDAARWREGLAPSPSLPEGVADEDELLRLIDAGRRPSDAAPKTASAGSADVATRGPAGSADAAARPAGIDSAGPTTEASRIDSAGPTTEPAVAGSTAPPVKRPGTGGTDPIKAAGTGLTPGARLRPAKAPRSGRAEARAGTRPVPGSPARADAPAAAGAAPVPGGSSEVGAPAASGSPGAEPPPPGGPAATATPAAKASPTRHRQGPSPVSPGGGPRPTPGTPARPSPTPRPAPTASPSPGAAPRPAPTTSPSPGAAPRPTPGAAPRPTPGAAPRPTPGAAPRPTPGAAPRPAPTASPSPGAVPRPTPGGTPRPPPGAGPRKSPGPRPRPRPRPRP